MISKGRAFHNVGATTANARSPFVLSLDEGISRRPLFEDLRDLTFGFGGSKSEMYDGAILCNALYVIKRILKLILDLMGNQ